jgi:hypothetical protein
MTAQWSVRSIGRQSPIVIRRSSTAPRCCECLAPTYIGGLRQCRPTPSVTGNAPAQKPRLRWTSCRWSITEWRHWIVSGRADQLEIHSLSPSLVDNLWSAAQARLRCVIKVPKRAADHTAAAVAGQQHLRASRAEKAMSTKSRRFRILRRLNSLPDFGRALSHADSP